MMSAKKRQRIRFIIAGGVALATSVAVAGFTFNDAIVFFVTPSELIAKAEAGEIGPDRRVRLGGVVELGSVSRSEGEVLVFRVTDDTSATPVRFRGVPPDLFRECQGVVAQGVYRDGVFVADEILAKHDENYQPPELAHKIDQPSECAPS